MRQVPQDGIDPNVKVPAAVKAAAARSESYYKASEEEPAKEGVDGSEAREPKTAEPAAEAKAPDQGTIEPPATTPPVASQGNEDDWQHRYNSMKGRFDRAQSDLKAQGDRITYLEKMLATIQVQAPTKAPATTEEAPKLITSEMEEEWGKEFLEVVGKKAQEAYQPIVSTMERKIKELEQQLSKVGGHIAGDARGRMLNELDSKIPDWRKINENENFISWLQLPDTYSGAIRLQLLKEAFERNDSPRVAAFFQGFLAEEAAVAPAKGEPDRGQEKPGKVPLSSFAAPGRAKSAAAGAPAEKPVISRDQITRFYAQVAAGKFRGKEDEQSRFEKQIFEAQREGRIS